VKLCVISASLCASAVIVLTRMFTAETQRRFQFRSTTAFRDFLKDKLHIGYVFPETFPSPVHSNHNESASQSFGPLQLLSGCEQFVIEWRCFKSQRDALGKGQYRNALASGRSLDVQYFQEIAFIKADPTLPRYGTD
jgi:hypothetical protein